MTNKTDKNSNEPRSRAEAQSQSEQLPGNISAATMLLLLSAGVHRRPVVNLGEIVATANAVAEIPEHEVRKALVRHACGDWGEVCAEDRKENDLSLREGFRLLSVYRTSTGTKFWIITEWDRSLTTVLLPDDY
jgi:hypothetical protein